MEQINILFMGRKPVAANCLEWLLSQKNVNVVGVLTDCHLELSPCKELAKKHNISTYTFEQASELIETHQLRFDLGISMLFWRKLKDGFIHNPRLKTINFHPAPLPDYKGTAGYNMAILDGLSSWSMTAHYVDEEIDTGEIIKSQTFAICPDTETAQSLERLSQGHLLTLFKDVISQVLNLNKILPTTPNIGGKYISRKQMEEMKEIKSGDDVSRKIRAFWFPPYTGAYIKVNGKAFTLVNDEILESIADSSVSKVF